MPKKKGFFRRARARASSAFRRHSRKSSGSLMGMLLPAAGYGAARPYLAKLIDPLASKIPGTYGDELILGVAGYLAAKKGSGIVGQLGKAALTVEAASVGFQLSQGALNSNASMTSSDW